MRRFLLLTPLVFLLAILPWNANADSVRNTATFSHLQWPLAETHIYQAWHYTQGAGVRVCVIDSGYSSHVDTSDAVVGEVDTVDAKGDASDGAFHGTFVVGEIAARGRLLSGVAPQADILAAKALDDTGSGARAAASAAVFWCVASGAKVINMSFGAQADQYDGVAATITYACKHNVYIAAASGNDATSDKVDPASVQSPCLIAVMATSKNYWPTSFTNYAQNSRMIAAPGANILGDWEPGNWVAYLSGTSMATPLVSGCMALLASEGIPATEGVKLLLATENYHPTPSVVEFPHAGFLDCGAAVKAAS